MIRSFRLKSLVSVLVMLVFVVHVGASPAITKGFLDLSNADLNRNHVTLNGAWYFFDNTLTNPDEIVANGKGFTSFPKIWNESIHDNGAGYATYALFVLPPKDIDQLALTIPQLYSSYSLWIDDKLVAVNGKVGKTSDETIPQWMPQTVSFENPGDTLRIVLQISNFHHHNGGAKEPILIGSSTLLQAERSLAITGNVIESVTLGALALVFFVIYFATRTRKIIMYFALLCLTWAVRVGFSNLYSFISYRPDFDWSLMVKIEYITLFLTMIWAILFLAKAFPKEENKIFKYLLVVSNILFIIYTLFTEPLSFTQWLPLYLAFCVVLLGYAAFIVLRGWVNQRIGANYMTMSVFLALVIFSYDVFTFEGLFSYNAIIFSVAYVVLFSLMSMALLLNLNIVKSKKKSITKLTYKDLYS